MNGQNITPEEAIDQVYKYGGKILGKDVQTVAAQAEKAKGIFGRAKQLFAYCKDIMNILAMLRDYTSGAYTEVPWRVIAALTGAVVYVFSPIDLVPDLIPIFGFADDATVFAAVLSFARIDINAYLSWKLSKGEKIEGGSTECGSDLPKVDQQDDITNWTLKDFVEVVHNALASMQGTAVQWFWGQENISPKWDNIHQKIMGGSGDINDVLGVIDTSSFGNCKEGFVFTKDRLYFRQFGEYSFNYKWREIIAFERDGKKLYINGTPADNVFNDEASAERVFKVIRAVLNRAELTPEPAPIDETRERTMGELAYEVFLPVDKGDRIFIGNNIPEKKRINAHHAMGVKEPAADIVVLIDTTIFGSGEKGIVLTSRAIYGKGDDLPCRIAWDALTTVSPYGDNIALNFQDAIIPLGVLFSKCDIICNAISKLRDEKLNEHQRAFEASLERNHKERLARAERFLRKTVDEFESEKAFLDAGKEAEQKYIAETTVTAEIAKELHDGLRIIKDNVPAAGGWKVEGGKYYLNEPIRLGESVSLFMKDAEIHFGNKGFIELGGGEAQIENCRFVSDDKVADEKAPRGSYIFTGKTSKGWYKNCTFDGADTRAAIIVSGSLVLVRCKFANMFTNSPSGTIVGTLYSKADPSKISIQECSFENCAVTALSIVWAMQTWIYDCEFVGCSSPSAIVTVVEDCKFDISRTVFDNCSVKDGSVIVSLYCNGGSAMAEGEGIESCWLKNCHNQYAYSIGIPISSDSGWVNEETYKNRKDLAGIGPMFLRDGSLPREQIGAGVITDIADASSSSKTKKRSAKDAGATVTTDKKPKKTSKTTPKKAKA